MAKKKAPVLTPEERLKQALVPEAEQPYSIPENWCWVKAKFIAEIYTGNSISEKIKAEKYTGKIYGLPFIATKDVGFDNEINYETNVRIPDFSNFKIAPQNTALLCIEGGSAGRKVGFTTQDICFGNKLCAFATRTVSSKLIYYMLQSQYFVDQFSRKKHGLIGGVSVKDLEEIGFSIPPLAEQYRIVSRIESLFAKLDEAKEKLQAVIDGHEPRRAAILHRAFTGELTARWRVNKGTSFTDWRDELLKNVTTRITAGGDKPEDFTELQDECHKIPVVANGVSNDGIIGYTSQARVTGETVTVAGRGTIGHAIFRAYPYYPVVRLIVIEVQNCLDARYLRCVFEEYPEKGTGSSIPQLTVPVVKEKRLPVPPIEEQQEIVRILDSLFAKEQQVLVAAQAALTQIDVIKKSILARAFRGELGTNDPAEESAVNLIATLPREG